MCDLSLKKSEDSFLFFVLVLLYSVFCLFFFSFLLLLLSVNAVSSNIDKVLSISLFSNYLSLETFKVWLMYFYGNDIPNEICYNFSMTNNVIYIVVFPTRFLFIVLIFLSYFFLLTLIFVLQWAYFHFVHLFIVQLLIILVRLIFGDHERSFSWEKIFSLGSCSTIVSTSIRPFPNLILFQSLLFYLHLKFFLNGLVICP